ncbi:MAG: hypothetical protein ABS874_07165 [Lachnospiraceae bacterium]
MKNLKKWTALVLAGIMTLSVSACGSGAGRGTVETKSGSSKTESAAGSAVAAAEMTAEESAEAKAEKEDENFSTGEISGTTYKQEFFKIQLTRDTPWVFESEEELKAQNQAIIDASDDDEVKEAVDKGNLYVDMTVSNQETGEVTMVRILKVGLADMLSSDSDLAETMKKSLIEDLNSTDGVSGGTGTVEDTTFLGKSVPSAYVTGVLNYSGQEFDVFERCVIVRKGTFIAVVIATALIEDTTADQLAAFTAI